MPTRIPEAEANCVAKLFQHDLVRTGVESSMAA
jgi:hypothetical protein